MESEMTVEHVAALTAERDALLAKNKDLHDRLAKQKLRANELEAKVIHLTNALEAEQKENEALTAERDALAVKVAELQAVVDRLPNYRALLDIGEERMRQVEIEGWTEAHDDKYTEEELELAAAAYAMADTKHPHTVQGIDIRLWLWPWDKAWWKPTNWRRNKVKAGALIVAAIERFDREAALAAQSAKAT